MCGFIRSKSLRRLAAAMFAAIFAASAAGCARPGERGAQADPAGETLALMRGLTADGVHDVSRLKDDDPEKREAFAAAIVEAAEHRVEDPPADVMEQFRTFPCWGGPDFYPEASAGGSEENGVRISLAASLEEGLVEVRRSQGGEVHTLYVQSDELYRLVRCRNDGPGVLDPNGALPTVRNGLDAIAARLMQVRNSALGDRNDGGRIVDFELTGFVLLERMDDAVGPFDAVEFFLLDYAYTLAVPGTDVMSGGMYIDSELRLHGLDPGAAYAAVGWKDGAVVSMRLLASDSYAAPEQDERPAAERAAAYAELLRENEWEWAA